MTEVHPWIAFVIDLIFLQFSLLKTFVWSIFRYLFRTKKSVRHEIVLITGSAKGLGNYQINSQPLGSVN